MIDGKKISIVLLIILILPLSGRAGTFMDQFRDPKDGALDTSEWLVERKGFLPVPIFVTEPAVGYGLGAALLFFHESKKDKQERLAESDDERLSLPPSISAVAGAYTENDSWFVGGGHFGSWRDDRMRYIGGLGGASLNLRFYGAGIDPTIDSGGLEI